MRNEGAPSQLWRVLEEGGSSPVNEAYTVSARPELLDMIEGVPRLALDVGCSTGETLAELKRRYPGVKTIGVELNLHAARIAEEKNIDIVINDKVENIDWVGYGVEPGAVDLVIFADVLEHTYSPWHVLEAVRQILSDDAQVLVSLPNTQYIDLVEGLLRDGWVYQPAGLLDITHIRFFALDQMVQMLQDTGYKVAKTVSSRSSRSDAFYSKNEKCYDDGFLRVNGIDQLAWNKYTTFQYFFRCVPDVVARKTGAKNETIKIVVYSFDLESSACGYIRGVLPWRSLPENCVVEYGVSKRGESLFVDGYPLDADLYVIQRQFPCAETAQLLDRIYSSGVPVVYDLDDNFIDIPETNPHYSACVSSSPYLLRALRQSDFVVVSTETLGEQLSKYSNNIKIIPNRVPVGSEPVWTRSIPGRHVMILIGGTPSHEKDFSLIANVVSKVLNKYGSERVRFLIWGCPVDGVHEFAGVSYLPYESDYEKYLNRLRAGDINIGLVPLEDSSFNRAKSNIKWLEYASSGIVGIFSDLPPYASVEDGVTGIKVGNDPDAWFDALCHLIDSPETLQQIREDAYQKISSLQAGYPGWSGLLSELFPPHYFETDRGCSAVVAEGGGKQPKIFTGKDSYKHWRMRSSIDEIDAYLYAERMHTTWKIYPNFCISVICLDGEEGSLERSINSLVSQIYKKWVLLVWAENPLHASLRFEDARIKVLSATEGDMDARLTNCFASEMETAWVSVVSPGVVYEPNALFVIADYINLYGRERAGLLYHDDDYYLDEEYLNPRFKPDFDIFLQRERSYLGFVFIAADRYMAIGGHGGSLLVGSYDLVLRFYDTYGDSGIVHIAEVISHLPLAVRDMLDVQAAKSCLLDHFERNGIVATALEHPVAPGFRVDYFCKAKDGVSIVIPTKNSFHLIRQCLESLIEKTRGVDYELVVVDNGSDDPDVFSYYAALDDNPNVLFKLLQHSGEFNFSELCNLGAGVATFPYLLFLNNDTKIVSETWLSKMLALAEQGNIGAVGATLVYPGTGNIQHSGVVLGMGTAASHPYMGMKFDVEHDAISACLFNHSASAVTAACLLTPKSLFDAVGGFDQDNLTVLYNDVDYCLRLGALGYRSVVSAYSVLIHEDNSSLGLRKKDPALISQDWVRKQTEEAFLFSKWTRKLGLDPFYNKHLSLTSSECRPDPTLVAQWDTSFHDRVRLLCMPDGGAAGRWRVSDPVMALGRAGLVQSTIVESNVWGKGRVMTYPELLRVSPDSIVWHTAMTDLHYDCIKMIASKTQIPQYLSIDDLLFDLPEQHPAKNTQFRDMRYRLRRTAKFCRRLIVSTEPLADAMRGMASDIVVVPNRLSTNLWSGLEPKRGVSQKPRVGWAGAQQHHGDLAMMLEVVRETASEVDWVFMGMCTDDLRPYIAEEHPWVSVFEDYPTRLASLNLDVAIAPLEANAFNEAKSNLRLLEYGIMGWPVIATDIYPYRTNNPPIVRVRNDARSWIEAIRAYAHDLDAAYLAGDRLKAWVEANYILEDHLDEWAKAYDLSDWWVWASRENFNPYLKPSVKPKV